MIKRWKIIIEYKGEILEITTEAKYYSDAYIYAEMNYPGCTVRSVVEIRSE
jgi:hypothetical protein